MAGAFGFVEDNYEVWLRIGERVLLPKVRAASADTLIIADGFSCREQIEQTTNRRALHLAEVLRMAYGNDEKQLTRRVRGRPLIRASRTFSPARRGRRGSSPS